MVRILYFVFIVSYIISGCTHGRTESQNNRNANHKADTFHLICTEKTELLDDYFSKLQRLKGFNGNVLIAQNGNIIFKKSFGFAHFKNRDSLTSETLFQLGSVTKQFTAVAILMLYEKGMLSLDDTIQQILPDFPYKGITIRMLLCHRSGLPNYVYFAEYHIKDQSRFYSNDEILAMMAKNPPPAYHRPGRRFDYSNTGYIVLSSIIEAVSGKSYASFLTENIFKPLGMNHTVVYNDSNLQQFHCATGYSKRMRPHGLYYLNTVTGDKGIYSTTDDLLKWDQALYDEKMISRQTLEMAFSPHGRKLSARWNYGFGWRIYYMPDSTKILFHGGWWQGFQSMLVHIPKDRATIIVLKNKEGGSLGNKEEILKILYPETEPGDIEKQDSILSLNSTF